MIMTLEKMSRDELETLKRELGRRLSTIENFLDRQAFGSADQDEIDELNEEYEQIEKKLEIIRGLLNKNVR